ncbi:von Willebrand factor-like [Glandiceps talaboti]
MIPNESAVLRLTCLAILIFSPVLVVAQDSIGQRFCNEVVDEVVQVQLTERLIKPCAEQDEFDKLLTVLDDVSCQVNRTTTKDVTQQVTRVRCCEGWTGTDCDQPICSTPCQHNGKCVEPNVCECIGTLYIGTYCEKPLCDALCEEDNHGICVAPFECQCNPGYEGEFCQLSLCSKPCEHGGICIGPNNCDCSETDYTGSHCEKAVCDSFCETGNRGVCVSPGLCQCNLGYAGSLCEVYFNQKKFPLLNILTGTCFLFVFVVLALVNIDVARPGNDDSGVCSMWGGKHYSSFDNKHFTFPGKCTYVMASECMESAFSIAVDTAFDCTGDVCKAAVHIRSEISQVDIQPNGVFINNFEASLPVSHNDITVTQIGVYTILEGFSGVKVSYDGHQSVFVTVDKEFSGRMCGLCGNYNNNYEDDFQMSPYTDKIAETPEEFGNTMKEIGQSCDVIQPYSNHPCAAVNEIDPYAVSEINNYCQQMKFHDSFAICGDVVNATAYASVCLYDICSCFSSGSDDFYVCGEDAFIQYSRACAQNGVVLDWRYDGSVKLSTPLMCNNGMEFTECGSACPRTCGNAGFEPECTEMCIDGCQCPVGTLYNGQECVIKDDCPCENRDQEYPTGAVVPEGCNTW